jgi:hypothetical protein
VTSGIGIKVYAGFRGAGVPPAVFLVAMRLKTAGETPAPQHLEKPHPYEPPALECGFYRVYVSVGQTIKTKFFRKCLQARCLEQGPAKRSA